MKFTKWETEFKEFKIFVDSTNFRIWELIKINDRLEKRTEKLIRRNDLLRKRIEKLKLKQKNV